MKRGTSGLSLVVAVSKPSGMTSHDVVNRCRRIFGERRVGHTGTLDPLATGVLPICVGPATRLDRYLTGHDKRYRVTIGFGFETDTDDCQGVPTVFGDVAPDLLYGDFAETYVAGLVGKRMQVPPQYSAIKVNGRKAYELARAGTGVQLEARPIEVHEARLVERGMRDGMVCWVVDFAVSKGTYIRALVRDLGRELGSRAHVVALERVEAGAITLADCVSLESLEARGAECALDPVRVLGLRFAFGDACRKALESGGFLAEDAVELREFAGAPAFDACACMGSTVPSGEPARDGELISLVADNRLKAIYRFDASSARYKPDCVFSTAVSR